MASAVSTHLIKNVCDDAGSGGKPDDWCMGFSVKIRAFSAGVRLVLLTVIVMEFVNDKVVEG